MPSPRYAILLRGINVGAANRLAMPALREALAGAGFSDVQTYVQSGNIVLRSDVSPAGLASEVERLLMERFELGVPVVVRTHAELMTTIQSNPFPELAQLNPKRFQVTFLSAEPDGDAVLELEALAEASDERFAARGRELYTWQPDGIHLSKVGPKLTHKRLGVRIATSRNWTTVTKLLEMANA